jgi:hypothetical protein
MADRRPVNILLLPERRHFRGQSFSPAFQRLAPRFAAETLDAGEYAQLQRYFRCIPSGLPLASILRQKEFADAGDDLWLRADPVYIQAEIGAARILAWDNLSVSEEHGNAILSAFKPLFGDAGFEFSRGRGQSFYLRALQNSPIPDFAPASDILGRDLTGLLPGDRKWVALFNECQIVLHNHPINVARQRQGLLPVNGLWFWGGGILPGQISHGFKQIDSLSEDLLALKSASGDSAARSDNLIDLRQCRAWNDVEVRFDSRMETIFDFSDGQQWHWQPSYRWQFWRRRSLGFA